MSCSHSRLFFSLLALLVAACVKENRDSCPCILVLSTEKTADSAAVFNVYLSREEPVADTVEAGSVYREAVPRGFLYATLTSGDGGMFIPGEGIVIPYGSDCPPLFLWSRPIKAEGEILGRVAVLSKNYCKVRMRLTLSGGGIGFAVRGGISGFDLDGRPSEGPFMCVPRVADDGFMEFNLPRQKDNSLMLDIYSGDVHLRTFALGEILSRAGYSWKDKDLKDISLEVSCSASLLLTDISVWEIEENMEILL